ncbi:MAG TPA: 3D domain-containing protein [Tepidisphaeraceae bacterium]|nr:3D domain-containing protein [Tepidisphaeraceae bacterium]
MIDIRNANVTRSLSLTQRTARGLLVGLCGMLAVGVVGAVSARAVDTTTAAVTRSGDPAVAAVELVPSAMAAQELLVEDEAALPGLAVETVRPVVFTATPTPSRKVRTLTMDVTAYCACKKCCGKNAQGLTASGKPVSYNKGRFVAVDPRVLKMGTKLSIPGYHDGRVVEAIDTGSAIKGNKLDVYFPDHETAKRWGRQTLTVTIID